MNIHTDGYYEQYHKKHYVSNTTTRDKNNRETLGKILTIILYFANKAGEDFRLEMFKDKEVSKLREQGWTEPFAIDQNTVAEITASSRATISRSLAKLEEQKYIINIGKYTFADSNYPSNMYIVDEWTINKDYGEEIDKNKSLYDKFNTYTHKDNKSSIALNNKCMKQPLWQAVSKMIAEANEGRHELAKVKFLVQLENGDYEGGRYYSHLCSTKNPEHDPETRYAKLNEIFGTTDAKFIEIDVNSMTYRTQYNLIHDEYLDINEDFYYTLYKKMTDSPMNYPIFKKIARALIKSNCMPINMEPRSVYCKTVMLSEAKNLNKVKEQFCIDQIESVFNMSYGEFLNRLKEAMYQVLSVYDFDGDKRVFLGRMFFKYEAIIYYYMHKEFESLGIKTANVYDGWYFIEGTCDKETFYKVYHKAIDSTKKLLKEYNHDLVKLYGKKYTLKYRVFKKVESKKTERTRGTYDIPTTVKVETVKETANEHEAKQIAYVESVKQKAMERLAQGKKAFY